MSSINDYWDAFERLKNNQPKVVPKGTLINNDTVALEAGRSRGAIKKSRKSFKELIAEIELFNKEQHTTNRTDKDKLKDERLKSKNYRDLYHQSLNREIMLVERLAQLEKELAKFKNVTPFNRKG